MLLTKSLNISFWTLNYLHALLTQICIIPCKKFNYCVDIVEKYKLKQKRLKLHSKIH